MDAHPDSSTLPHRVAFFETDAMGIVHHSNYVRYFELVRVLWMDEHDRPYREYVAEGLHFATTRVEVEYRRPARFDDVLALCCWLEHLRGASLQLAYQIRRDAETIASGMTEHAMVNGEGRPRRIPRERHRILATRLPPPAPPSDGDRDR